MNNYNHAYDLAFEVISYKEEPSETDILIGLQKRVDYLKNNPHEIKQSCSKFDSYKMDNYEE